MIINNITKYTKIFFAILLMLCLVPRQALAEGNPFVPTTDVLGTGLQAQVGGVELNSASQNLANFTDISGAYYDSNLKRIVFFGKTDGPGPKYSKDDMAVAIKSIFFANLMPDLTIIDDPANPTSNTAIVSYTGPIQNTNLGSTLFNSDFKLKQYVIGYNPSNVKITSTVPSYKSVVDRYVTLNPNPVAGNQTKFILSPQNITLKNAPAQSAFVFTSLTMQAVAQQMNPLNDPKWNQAATEFSTDLSANYDQYAQETPSFAQAKQLAKIISILKWIQDQNIPTDLHWAQNYSPTTVSTPTTVAKVTTPQFPNGYTAKGQVSYLTPNSYIADDGTAASLKSSAQAGSTSQEDVVWTFTNGGQQYQAVAVAAQAMKSLGGYSTQISDFSIPIVGEMNLDFRRTYSSLNNAQLGIGKGWDFLPARLYENLFPEDFNLVICNDAIFFQRLAIDTPFGHETFAYNCPSGYTADDPSFHSTLVLNSDETITVTSSNQFKYKFNNNFQLVSVTDKNGNVINYTYDSSGKLTKIADTKNHELNIAYNAQSLISQVTDWSGRKVQYNYNQDGMLIGVVDPLNNTTTFGYDNNLRLTTITDRTGQLVLTNTYNSDGKIVTQKNAAGLIKTNTYDLTNKLITQTDSNNRTVKTTYDQRARILTQTDALNKNIVYTYGNESVPLSQTDRNNNKTSYTYDSKGNVLTVTFPDNKTVTYTYDSGNRILKVVDTRYGATPKQTDYTYDAKGNQIQRSEAGTFTKNTYDSTGEILTFIDPLNKVTTWTRDTLGNPLTEKDANNNTATYEYDSIGRLKKTTDQDGKIFSQTLDANGNVLSLVNSAGITNNVYDKENRLIKITLPNNTINQYSYNSSGSMTSVTDPLNNVTNYGYDIYQNLLTQTDALGKITTHSYDILNRHTEEKTPMGNTTKFEYDSNGNITKRTDSLNRATTYTYDAFNRLTKITYPDGKTVTNEYDNRGNKTKMTDSSGVSAYSFDNFDRITQYTNPYGKYLKYEYDKSDNLLKLIYPDNKAVTYTYDNKNQMLTVTDWQNLKTTYTYNKNGTLATRSYPNTISSKYTYDGSNRLTELEHKKGTAVALKFVYQLDAVGNVLVETPSGSFTSIPKPLSFTYDSMGRVITQRSEDREGDRDYTYDKVGNILTNNKDGDIFTYTYDNDYRLVNKQDPFWGNLPQTNDANGNQITRRSESNPADTLIYDFDNRLTKLDHPDSNSEDVSFKYDGDGNRIEQSQPYPFDTVRYVSDLSNSLSRVIVETDENNVIENWNVYGLGIISQGRPDTYRNYYLEDGRGNLKTLTGRTGSNNRMAYYDAYGEIQWGDKENYGFAGQEYDPNVTLNYMRARYYDPEIGRFISRDPVKGKTTIPQSQHPYMYAYNNPVNISDPSGECPMCLIPAALILAPMITASMPGMIAMGDLIIQDVKSGNFVGAADKVTFLIPGTYSIKGGLLFGVHVREAMLARKIGFNKIFDLVYSGKSFSYFHEGLWKTGHFDPISGLFVGRIGREIKTVFYPKNGQSYVDDLIKNSPKK